MSSERRVVGVRYMLRHTDGRTLKSKDRAWLLDWRRDSQDPKAWRLVRLKPRPRLTPDDVARAVREAVESERGAIIGICERLYNYRKYYAHLPASGPGAMGEMHAAKSIVDAIRKRGASGEHLHPKAGDAVAYLEAAGTPATRELAGLVREAYGKRGASGEGDR
jgi:hypothetical protein